MPDPQPNLRRLVKELPVPSNFYRGVALPWGGLPKDVLLFSRRKPIARSLGVHHRFVLILALEGQGAVVVDEKLHQLKTDKAILVFPFQRHYYADFANQNILWLFIGFELDETAPLAMLRDNVIQLEKADWALVSELAAAFHGSLQGKTTSAHEVSLWLSLLLLRLKRRAHRLVKEDWELTRLQTIIQRVAQYVAQHVGQPMRLDSIARAAGVSRSHLQRICRQTMAASLGQYVRHARMNQACARLHSSDATITEIAAGSGFSSIYAFSRAFKAEIGLSPLKYRRQFRSKQTRRAAAAMAGEADKGQCGSSIGRPHDSCIDKNSSCQ